MTRRKPFLTYLGLCAIPLLLLAGLNYWNGLRSVDSTTSAIVQNDLHAFNVAIDAELRERKSDFLRLSMMRDVQYIVSDKERIDVIPQGLFLTLKMLPPLKEFQTLTIFNRDRRAFVYRRGESEWTTVANSHVAEFTEPAPQVWETQGNVSLERIVGKTVEYSAPIHDEKGTNIIGGLIGVLDLDDMFARAAHGLESKSSQLMVMALDRSGKIVYHSNRSLKDLQINQAVPGFNTIANAMTNNDSGVREFKSPAGSYLAAYSPVPQLNVAVAVARDRAAALSSAHRWGIAGLVFALLAAAIGGVLGTFVGGWQVPDTRQTFALVTLAVLVTALAFGLWYFSVNRLGSDRAGVLIGLMPVSGLATSVLLGLQELTLVSVVGVTTVALGCAIALWRGTPNRVAADVSPSERPCELPAARAT